MEPTDLLTISEVARRSGFAASALRYYEAEGLLDAQRSGGNQRRYERNVLRRLAFIRAASNVGLTITEIREELDRLPHGRAPKRSDWNAISRHWRGRLNERIEALERLRDNLDSCIGCGCLSLDRCAMANPDDIAADTGRQGAAFLPPLLRRAPGSDL